MPGVPIPDGAALPPYYAGKAHQAERIGDLYYRYDGNGNMIEEREGGHGTGTVTAGTIRATGDVRSTDTGFGIARTTGSGESPSKTVYARYYAWDEENRLIRSVDNHIAVDYRYGADGQRAAKYSKNGESLYFDSMWQVQTDYPDLRQLKNIYVGQTRIATRVNIAGYESEKSDEENTYYYHPDHLGSAQLVTDHEGKEYERIEYTPYGESWIEKAADGVEMLPFRFTGKELDAETGLYYYGARYLNPKTSVWISADPALGEYLPAAPVDDEARKHNGNLPGQGGVFNLVNLAVYHYAANNPVKYTDPDGKETNIVMLFDKSSQTMSVTIYNGDAHPIQFTYDASSVPSTSRSPDYPGTMDSNEAYYPTSFPNGTYNICGADVVHPDNDAYGHTEIKVEATQEVPTYVKGKDGWQATGRTTTDRHYQIHGGGYTGSPQGKNNYLDKTFGCIRMKNADIDKLGEMIKKASDSGGTITLTVQE